MNERVINRDVTIAGQPSAADIAGYEQAGYHTVINLRTEGEAGQLADERERVEATGMNYAAIPVAPDTLDDIAVGRFIQAIESDGAKPAVAHCKSGGRAGLMTLLYLAVTHGWSIEQALAQGQAMGGIGPAAASPYRAFFEGYLKRHSAGER